MDSASASGDLAAQVSRLRQFLAWLLGLTAGFAAIAGSAAATLGDWSLAAKTVVIVGFLGLMLLARARLNRGQPSVAVTIIVAGLIGVALVAAAIVPSAFPVLAVLPLLAATVALPYLDGRALRRLFASCWLAATLIVILGEVLVSPTALPSWFFGSFRGTALITAVALILLLLWQFHQRLSEILEQAQAARQRLAFLADVSHSLAESLAIETTVGKVAELAVPTLADSCTVALLLPDGRARAVAIVRIDPARAALMRDLWARLPPSIDTPGPFGEVLRTGRPVLYEDAATAFDGERERDVFHQLANRSYMVVPLVAHGRTLGALSLATAESERRLTATDLALAEEVARRAAVAIDNARLYAAEQQARQTAELAHQRLQFLAQADAVLASSLDYQATLATVARLATPVLADYCLVDLINEAGQIERISAIHANPARQPLVEQLRRFPPPLDGTSPVARAIQTAQAQLVPVVTEEILVATVPYSDEQMGVMRALEVRSGLVVPLTARGRTLGAIALGMTAESERRYGPAEQAVAEELAHRAALAIDNARLHAAEQQARAIAQAQAQQREEFLAIAAHELRTPLTTVKGYVQRMGRLLRPPTVDRERLASTQTALEQQVARLESLIGDLLDVARLQQGGPVALRQRTVDLVALTHRVTEHVMDGLEPAPRHHLVVEAPEPVVGCWDGDRLEQVLTNLISNALKYSPAGGTVRVAVRQRAEEAILSVSDQGVGIAPADRSRLFQPFGRGEQGQDRVQGVGLGLYIAAQIVARHGGTIAVDSALGVGSTFTVRLPLTAQG